MYGGPKTADKIVDRPKAPKKNRPNLLRGRGVMGGWCVPPPPPPARDASEGKGPQRRPHRRLDRRLEEVAKAVGGGYCRLQMPLELVVAIRDHVADVFWCMFGTCKQRGN